MRTIQKISCLQAPSKTPRTAQAASQGPRQRSRQGISRATGVRCLAIMEQVAAAVQDAGMGLQLADAMLPLLNQKGGSRWGREEMLCGMSALHDRRREPADDVAIFLFREPRQVTSNSCPRRLDQCSLGLELRRQTACGACETNVMYKYRCRQCRRAAGAQADAAAARTLAVLAALWARLASENPPETLTEHQAAFERYAAALTPLAGTLSSASAREVLTRAFAALAQLLPALEGPAQLLRQLSLMSATEIDQPDYDARLQAYRCELFRDWSAQDCAGVCSDAVAAAQPSCGMFDNGLRLH